MKRLAYLIAGWAALLLGTLGIVLPVMPTVPFVLLAAFCFAKSSPELERKLVQHPKYGPHIKAWRTRGAISRTGKRAAYSAFAISAALGIVLLQGPVALLPAVIGILGASWIFRRPTT